LMTTRHQSWSHLYLPATQVWCSGVEARVGCQRPGWATKPPDLGETERGLCVQTHTAQPAFEPSLPWIQVTDVVQLASVAEQVLVQLHLCESNIVRSTVSR
jgi:hypothetical protein